MFDTPQVTPERLPHTLQVDGVLSEGVPMQLQLITRGTDGVTVLPQWEYIEGFFDLHPDILDAQKDERHKD